MVHISPGKARFIAAQINKTARSTEIQPEFEKKLILAYPL
ncbi:hypothetical protein L579_0218 [Pantoea sp. AS-PWVM4]|nr:hypothetical protein L579_0218 [Pantoea sp. AS-PWVM4]